MMDPIVCDSPGVVYNVDLLEEERKFYLECQLEREEDEILTGRDSGFESARWDRKPPCVTTHSFGERLEGYDVTREISRRLKRKALEEEATMNTSVLTEEAISQKMLDYLMIPIMEHNGLKIDDELFIRDNDWLYCDSKYYCVTHLSLKTIEFLSQVLLSTFDKFSTILSFVDNSKHLDNSPLFVKALLSFLNKFFISFTNSINEIRTQNPAPWRVPCMTKGIREQVDLLYKIIAQIFKFKFISYEEIEIAWCCLFDVTGVTSMLTKAQIELSQQLQDLFIPIFLRRMDYLYVYNAHPTKANENDVFVYLNWSEEQLAERENNLYSLWSVGCISEVLKGIEYHSIGKGNNRFEPLFSSKVQEALKYERDYYNRRLVEASLLCRILRQTAVSIAETSNKELLEFIGLDNILKLWSDLRSLLIGQVAGAIAEALYAPSSNFDIFCMLHNQGKLSDIAHWRFSLNQSSFICDLPSPLNKVFKKSLIDNCNGFFHLWLRLYRMKKLLEAILYDTSRGAVGEIPSLRKYLYVVSRLYRVLEILREQLYAKIDTTWEKAQLALESSTTFSQAENVCRRTEQQLSIFTNSESNGKLQGLISIIDMYAGWIDDIRLTTLSNQVTVAMISKWSVEVTKTIKLLSLLGKDAPHSSVFHLIYLQLNYRSREERE